MSHLEPSETKISLGFLPTWAYRRSVMASRSLLWPCSEPYLHRHSQEEEGMTWQSSRQICQGCALPPQGLQGAHAPHPE